MVPFHAKHNEIAYIFPKSVQNLNCVSSDYYKVKISTNYEKIIVKFECSFHSSCKPEFYFPRSKGDNSHKKGFKRIIL